MRRGFEKFVAALISPSEPRRSTDGGPKHAGAWRWRFIWVLGGLLTMARSACGGDVGTQRPEDVSWVILRTMRRPLAGSTPTRASRPIEDRFGFAWWMHCVKECPRRGP